MNVSGPISTRSAAADRRCWFQDVLHELLRVESAYQESRPPRQRSVSLVHWVNCSRFGARCVRDLGFAAGLPCGSGGGRRRQDFHLWVVSAGRERAGRRDVDVLCLGPKHFSRAAFFVHFKDRLMKKAGVTEVLAVPHVRLCLC